MNNQFSEKDRVCVNCRYFRREWSLNVLLNTNEHYRCVFDGEYRSMDPVTGREVITITSKICKEERQNVCRGGRNWQPSDRFAARQENLFKVMDHINNSSKNE